MKSWGYILYEVFVVALSWHQFGGVETPAAKNPYMAVAENPSGGGLRPLPSGSLNFVPVSGTFESRSQGDMNLVPVRCREIPT